MICTVQYMYRTLPVNIDELQQVEYDMYVQYMILLHLLQLQQWSMMCTVQYMNLNLPVNIDELQQVEYDMYCTIHGSYSTC